MTSSLDDIGNAQEAAKRNLWLHFTRMSSYEDSDVPVIVRGSGAYVFDQHGRRYLDGLSGLFVTPGRPRPPGDRRGGRAAGGRARLLPAVVLRPSQGHRAGGEAGRAGPGRPEPGVLHHQRLGGRGVGVETGQAVLQADRPARTVQGDQPRHRLPRVVHGCARDHRPGRHQVPVRAADARAASGCRTPTSTGPPRSCATTWRCSAIGPPTRSSGPSCARDRNRSPRSSWSPCRTPAAASRPRPATSSGSGRSATGTACCWSRTR